MEKYTLYFENSPIKSKWTFDKSIFNKGPICVEFEYPSDYISYDEEQQKLPTTKRQYLDEKNGYYVSYQTAKKKGLI